MAVAQVEGEASAQRSNVTTTLASSLDYAPFGPLKGLTYGNGINETRGFDRAGRLSSITAPGKQRQTLGYDAADNLTAITGALRPEQGGTFTYDTLGRLVTETSPAGNCVFTYDANGNRVWMEQTSAPASTAHSRWTPRATAWASVPGQRWPSTPPVTKRATPRRARPTLTTTPGASGRRAWAGC